MKLYERRFFVMTVIISLFVSASAIFHASAQQSNCPTVRATCPDMVYLGDGALTFTANVTGGDPNVTPTYNWTVSNGTISSGQGTSVITVDLTGLTDNSTVTATVDVGGYDRACSTSSSCTASVMKKAEGRKFDEYGKIVAKDANKRLDNFAIELKNDPGAVGYVITYGGRRSKAGEAKTMAAAARTYLVKKRKIVAQQVMTLDGGFREEPTTELWLVPSGAEPPQATPNVDPSEVVGPIKPAKSKSKSKSSKPAKTKTATRKKS
ncbi:MAG TPA: hypothetical protein VKA70_01785 [Blastocatellia bacterium]|nr:hypothetical protein [Blastocatellia bacterium]